MKHWLNGHDWLHALYERRKDVWFDWMSESASADFKQQLLETYQGDSLEYMVPPFFREMAIIRMERCVPLAYGKTTVSFDIEADYRPVWWFDPEFPDLIWLSISEEFPAFFWVGVASDDAAIEAAIAGNLAETSKPVHELLGHARLFAGTADELQMDLQNFENHYVLTPPCSTHMWGSEFEFDPWPASSRDLSQTDKVVEFRRNMMQRVGRVPRTSFRTAFSRSVLTVENHNDSFVFDLRYDPQPISDQVSAFCDSLGADYPRDAPADLLAAILGFRNLTQNTIVGPLNRGEFDYLWADLQTLAVLITNPLEFEKLLRTWIVTEDLDARLRFTSIAHSCMFDALLYERWGIETDPEIAEWLDTTLGPKVAS